MKQVYVITAVHNRKEITERFINNLIKQTYENIHLVLVDDGSTDGTDQLVKEKYPNSTILYGNGNLWWGGALHKAYLYLCQQPINSDDIIFYANDDSRFDETFIQNGVSLVEEHPNVLVTGCGHGTISKNQLDGVFDFNFKNGAVKLLEPGKPGNCASTRALFMTYKIFKEIGGFHPVLLPHYASDYEYTIRAWKKGYPIISSNFLKYEFSEDTTGDNSHKNITLKKLLSKRSKLNPFYKLSFILMITPAYNLPRYIYYQLKRFNRKY